MSNSIYVTYSQDSTIFYNDEYICDVKDCMMKIDANYNAINVALYKRNSPKEIPLYLAEWKFLKGATYYCRWNSLDGVNIPQQILKKEGR